MMSTRAAGRSGARPGRSRSAPSGQRTAGVRECPVDYELDEFCTSEELLKLKISMIFCF